MLLEPAAGEHQRRELPAHVLVQVGNDEGAQPGVAADEAEVPVQVGVDAGLGRRESPVQPAVHRTHRGIDGLPRRGVELALRLRAYGAGLVGHARARVRDAGQLCRALAQHAGVQAQPQRGEQGDDRQRGQARPHEDTAGLRAGSIRRSPRCPSVEQRLHTEQAAREQIGPEAGDTQQHQPRQQFDVQVGHPRQIQHGRVPRQLIGQRNTPSSAAAVGQAASDCRDCSVHETSSLHDSVRVSAKPTW